MKHTKDAQIIAAWNMFEDAEPDISTERLMSMTASACGCSASDVSGALYRDSKKAPRPTGEPTK